jgi:hypothetical protein
LRAQRRRWDATTSDFGAEQTISRKFKRERAFVVRLERAACKVPPGREDLAGSNREGASDIPRDCDLSHEISGVNLPAYTSKNRPA